MTATRESTAPAEPQDGQGEVGGSRLAASERWLAAHFLGVLAGLLIVVLAGGLLLTTVKLRHREALDNARSAALKAAQADIVLLGSYDFQSLTQDFGRVLAVCTPAFRAQVSQGEKLIEPILTKYDASARASVLAAGVQSATTQHAVVVVFLNQTVTNSKAGHPTQTSDRLQISLVHSHGKWLLNQVTYL